MKFIAKKYYSFQELEARWDCTRVDLMQSVIDGELVPSLHIPGGAYELNHFTPESHEAADSHCSPRPLHDSSLDKTDNEVRTWLTGFRYLILPMRTSVLDCKFFYFSDTPRGHDDGDLCASLQSPVDIAYVFSSPGSACRLCGRPE